MHGFRGKWWFRPVGPVVRRLQLVGRNIERSFAMEQKTRVGGFASMDQEKQREIARKGGRAAHRKGTAHEFTAEEARFAGRKGGQRVATNRNHMIEIGRLGGKRSAERRRHRAANAVNPVVVDAEVEAPQVQSEPDSAGGVRQYDSGEGEQTRQQGMTEEEMNRQN